MLKAKTYHTMITSRKGKAVRGKCYRLEDNSVIIKDLGSEIPKVLIERLEARIPGRWDYSINHGYKREGDEYWWEFWPATVKVTDPKDGRMVEVPIREAFDRIKENTTPEEYREAARTWDYDRWGEDALIELFEEFHGYARLAEVALA